MSDVRPDYYGGADNVYEARKIIDAVEANFNVGTAIKYLIRYKKKGSAVLDLQKAMTYIQFEIDKLQNTAVTGVVAPAVTIDGGEGYVASSGGAVTSGDSNVYTFNTQQPHNVSEEIDSPSQAYENALNDTVTDNVVNVYQENNSL